MYKNCNNSIVFRFNNRSNSWIEDKQKIDTNCCSVVCGECENEKLFMNFFFISNWYALYFDNSSCLIINERILDDENFLYSFICVYIFLKKMLIVVEIRYECGLIFSINK